MSSGKSDRGESAIEDDQNDDMDDEEETGFKQSRMRRASEGQHLMKDGKKGSELKCDKCGKGYKHSSCLSKHLFVPTFLSSVLQLGFANASADGDGMKSIRKRLHTLDEHC
jgi:hypothetical protein